MRELVFPDPVEQTADLFDREGALEEIHLALQHRTRRCIVILGGRLVGKTSLLNVVAESAERRLSWGVIRLAHTSTRDHFAAEIVQGIRHAVDPDRRLAAAHEEEEVFRFPTVGGFVRAAEEFAARAPERRFLLCIDEFDSLLHGCSDDESRQILDLVLHLIEHTRLPIRFLVTMAEVPQRVLLSYASPFVNQSTIVELEPWLRPEAGRFADWLVGDALVLDEPTQRALYEAAGGHPYFTKAVLQTMLAGRRQPGDGVPAMAVRAAVASAARSPEVALALSNIAEAHLPEPAVRLLDRAAGSPNGLGPRVIRELGTPEAVVQMLLRRGMLSADDTQYRLRLGLWRQWRGSGSDGLPARAGRATRAVRLTRRWLGRRAIRLALVVLACSGLVALAVTQVFLGSADADVSDCTGRGAGLQAHLSYPSHVSVGDNQNLGITLSNDAAESVNGTAVVTFPPVGAGRVDVRSDNKVRLDNLGPGEQQTLEVAFTYRQPGRVIPDTVAGMAVLLRISADGSSCRPERWSIPVAPVPHLGNLRKVVLALIALVALPLTIEMLARKLGESRASRQVQDRPAGPHSAGTRG